MAQFSLLFDGATYQSADFRWMLAGLGQSSGGVFPGTGLVFNPGYAAFQPSADGASGLLVRVATASIAYAWLMGSAYRNDTSPNQSLTIQANASGSSRLDSIVLCLNVSGAPYTGGGTNPYTSGQSVADKSIGLAVRVGTPSGSPVAPTPVRTITSPSTTGVFELVLGWVTVPNGVVNVATVTDKRGDTTLCPWLAGTGPEVTSVNVGGTPLRGDIILQAGVHQTTVTQSGQTVTVDTQALQSLGAVGGGAPILTGPVVQVEGTGNTSVAFTAPSGPTPGKITVSSIAAPVSSVGGQTGAVAIAGAGGIQVTAAAGTVTLDAKPPAVGQYFNSTTNSVTTGGIGNYNTAWTITTTYAPTLVNDKAILFLNLALSATGFAGGDFADIMLQIDGASIAPTPGYRIPDSILTSTDYIPFCWVTPALSAGNHTFSILISSSLGTNFSIPPSNRYSSAVIFGFR